MLLVEVDHFLHFLTQFEQCFVGLLQASVGFRGMKFGGRRIAHNQRVYLPHGNYVFEMRTVLPGETESRIGDASLYEIRFGLQYDFE